MILFQDRRDAGRQLAARLEQFKARADVVVLGIPRGGIVVADEIARELEMPLDVFITRKIGAPFNPELALGAVASDGTTFIDNFLVEQLGIPFREVEREKELQMREIQRRAELYRRGQLPYELGAQVVILADDGVATGSTTVVGLRALARHQPARRILAVPVAPARVAENLARECDELVVLATPEPFQAVGRFYENFEQTTDDEVVEILAEARRRFDSRPRMADSSST
jgi:predicted phosphoribosyltransferase